MDDLRAQLQESLDGEGVAGTVHLFKNNVDSAGNAFGSHENYMIGAAPSSPACCSTCCRSW